MSAIPAYKASLAAGADGTRPARQRGCVRQGTDRGHAGRGSDRRREVARGLSGRREKPLPGKACEALCTAEVRPLGQMHLTTPGSSYQLIGCGFARPDAGWKRPAGGGPAPSAAEGGVTVRAHSPGERPARPPAGGPSHFGRAHSGAAIRRGREEPAT